jgi:hypothetical protein
MHWATFWATFSLTHLVTLATGQNLKKLPSVSSGDFCDGDLLFGNGQSCQGRNADGHLTNVIHFT